MEQITRAQTHLVVILAESASLQVGNADFGFDYLEAREHFQQATNEGLVDIVKTKKGPDHKILAFI